VLVKKATCKEYKFEKKILNKKVLTVKIECSIGQHNQHTDDG
jgi:hypothetical protein